MYRMSTFAILFSFLTVFLQLMMHSKCRAALYPFSKISRLQFIDKLVPWENPWPEYKPNIYNADVLKRAPWADPDIDDPNFKPKWNVIDNNVNRVSYTSTYKVVNGYPLNPRGRTGVAGRGVLGRWGPNHAADPIVTKWKRNENGTQIFNQSSSRPILQFCAIQRKDCKEWAIPGGMVDLGENVSATLKREFLEEAFNSLEANENKKSEMESLVNNLFSNGQEIYRGYVDDPRNTDNAWMETIACNFHDPTDDSVGKFKLRAGDDAVNVRWVDVSSELNLYASHKDFLKIVAEKHNAHW